MRNLLFKLIIIIGFPLLSGCSVYMAANLPTKKDLAILNIGTDRDYVIAEFGAPVTSEPTEDGRKEIYSFVQGYDKANKVSRAALHGVADVASIGLWEVIGTSVETAYSGEKVSVRILFDKEGKIKESKILSVDKISAPPKS